MVVIFSYGRTSGIQMELLLQVWKVAYDTASSIDARLPGVFHDEVWPWL